MFQQQSRKLTNHVEIWKTPGHTPEDLSVIIRDVPSFGTVAVVGKQSHCDSRKQAWNTIFNQILGDLIVNEDFLLNPSQWQNSGSWDRMVQQHNINLIVCMVDAIVPGHGPMFRLHDAHTKFSSCNQRYANKYANYFG